MKKVDIVDIAYNRGCDYRILPNLQTSPVEGNSLWIANASHGHMMASCAEDARCMVTA